jgi:hypothetical protein
MQKGFAMNPITNRIISKTTAKYRKLVKQGIIIEDIDVIEPPKVEPQKVEKIEPKIEKVKIEPVVKPQKEPIEPEYDESKLQSKLAEISTDLIQKNLKKIVKSQSLSDSEMDLLLRKMLYKKLCIDQPDKPAIKKVKKSKFKIVQPKTSSDESESD